MSNKRVGYLDLLRILSAFAIVTLHVISSAVDNNTIVVEEFIVSTLGSIEHLTNSAVPIFFMITGFLFLSSKHPCTYKNTFKNVIKLLIALVAFGGFYSLLEQVFEVRTFNFSMIIIAIKDILTGNLWAHMWYLYTIVGIYLLLPLVKPFFALENNNKDVTILVIISFVFAIVIPTLTNIFGITIGFYFPVITYTFYVFMGGFLGKFQLKPAFLPVAILGIITSAAMVILFPKYTNYLSISVCILSISIFALISILFKNYSPNAFIKELSACTWGIYLIHPLFLNLQIKLFNIYPLHYNPLISIPLNCIAIFLLSYLCIYVARKIPFIGKFVL